MACVCTSSACAWVVQFSFGGRSVKHILTSNPGCVLQSNITIKSWYLGNFLAVQWLGLHTFTAKGLGLISDKLRSHKLHSTAKKKKREKADVWIIVWFLDLYFYFSELRGKRDMIILLALQLLVFILYNILLGAMRNSKDYVHGPCPLRNL